MDRTSFYVLNYACSPFTISPRDIQPHKRQQSINHQQLVSELIPPALHSRLFKHKAHKRRRHSYVRHEFVARLSACKQTEGKQSQQRTVCIRAQDVYGIDNACRIERLEHQDKQTEHHGNADMCTAAQLLVALALANVHAIACGERCQCRVGT